ncbi:MAG TPA: hypothetical protein VGK24_17635 [Candidatus Angelobacter sp.]|jgi:tetratricopeptide (TPR) repeat protein
MNAEQTELTVFPPALRIPQWLRVLVCGLMFCLAVFGAMVGQLNALVVAMQSVASSVQPRAKSEHERNDFRAAYAVTGGEAEEAAADGFASRYPTSELSHYLYSSAMLQYQRENNPAKMLAMGERVLQLDPDNPLALVLTATAIADGLTDRDRDREKKIATIKRNATHAIQSAEAAYSTPATDSEPSPAMYKTTLQAMAYSALGIMKLKTGDDAGAEKDLKMASELAKIRPDPYIWYHLALAQDHRKKYAAALNSVEQALQLASSNPDLQRLAVVEHERLAELTKSPRNETPPGPQ